MTRELTEFVITEPGIYELTHEQYHADPIPGGSLSSTGARKLTPPDGSPARFKYDNGRVINKREFDFGQLAHNMLTGIGPEIVLIEHDDYRTGDARVARDQAYADGKIPVLPHEMDVVEDMMTALKEHTWAAAFFESGTGLCEPSLFWQQEGIWRRSRPDIVSYRRHPKTGQLMIADYKTAVSAQKHKFTKKAYDLGYHQQAAWICDAVRGVGIVPPDEDPMFCFVAQEKKPPYIPNVIQADSEALMWGRAMNEAAVAVYKQCRQSGRWPGYSDDIEFMAETPVYLTKTYEEFLDD